MTEDELLFHAFGMTREEAIETLRKDGVPEAGIMHFLECLDQDFVEKYREFVEDLVALKQVH